MTEIELYMSGGLNGKYIAIDGTETWYQNGQKHRLDGPARIWTDGSQEWWQNGLRHRLDGPVYIGADGTKWWAINGTDITKEVVDWMWSSSITWPFSKEVQLEFMLRFG